MENLQDNTVKMKFKTFQQAFLNLNKFIIENHEFKEQSRIGECLEVINLNYDVEDLTSFVFENKSVGRLNYEYMQDFYAWLVQGGTDVKELADKYPNVARFLDKPKSKELPDNFNTFYGPRIAHQLPFIKNELKTNPNSRRAVISIIDKDDLYLLDKDETLEFPCADSATFTIRNGKLNIHLHMRSQNMAQVLKLDMYLWARFTCQLAEEFGLQPGKFSSSIVSAHVFTKDTEYINSLIKENQNDII